MQQSVSRTENTTIPEKEGGQENQYGTVHPDPNFWPALIQIRNICTGVGFDLFDKKILIFVENFSSNGPIRLWLHTYLLENL